MAWAPIPYGTALPPERIPFAGIETVPLLDTSRPRLRTTATYDADLLSYFVWFEARGLGSSADEHDEVIIRIGGDCVSDCPADTNNDGAVTPADFKAWLSAFENGLPECDQNDDGLCSPTDFAAWIANYNAGC